MVDNTDDPNNSKQYSTTELTHIITEAFGDCKNNSSYGHEDRQLSFLSPGWFHLENRRYEDALEAIGYYNKFDHEEISDWLFQLDQLTDQDIRIAIGREMSPVIYIECDDADAIIEGKPARSKDKPASCDEFSKVDVEDMGPYSYDVAMSRRDEPIVPEEHLATPQDGKEVIRLWWD